MSTSELKGVKARSTISLAAVHKTALKSLLGAVGGGGGGGGVDVPRSSFPSSSSSSGPTGRPGSADRRSSLASLDETDVASLQQELDSLRRRKALLSGEVEQLRYGALQGTTRTNDISSDDSTSNAVPALTCTVADELEHVRTRADHAPGEFNAATNDNGGGKTSKSSKWANRQYLHRYDDRDGIGLVASGSNTNINNSRKRRRSLEGDVDSAISTAISRARQERTARTVAEQLHNLRAKRRVAAAHRLAGVSVLPFRKESGADDILGVRFDVCLNGEFVARYHVFFEIVLVLSNDGHQSPKKTIGDISNQCSTAVLRLAQHTLPAPGIAVQPILEKNFGPSGMLAVDVMDTSCKEAKLYDIRQCVGDIHDSCHAYAMRREACRYLRRKESNKRGNGARVWNVAHNDGYDRISFDFCLDANTSRNGSSSAAGGEINLTIQLCYDEQSIARPTSMGIKHDGDEVPDLDMMEAIEDIREALFSYPISVVLEEKIDPILRSTRK